MVTEGKFRRREEGDIVKDVSLGNERYVVGALHNAVDGVRRIRLPMCR